MRWAHLPRRRLVTRRLADHHGLDELTHDINEGLLRLAVRVLASVFGRGVEDHSTACGLPPPPACCSSPQDPLTPVIATGPLQGRCDAPRERRGRGAFKRHGH